MRMPIIGFSTFVFPNLMDYLLTLAADPAVWAALLTLVVMEVVLGIDNLIFISILSNKLPEAQRARTQRLGIGLALVMRLALLGTVAWIARLTEPVFSLFDHAFSWRDMILLAGGLFLVWKATTEIHHHVSRDGGEAGASNGAPGLTMWAAVGQILMLDIVFSIDSIVTAIGMTEHIPIMFVAVIAAVTVMLFAAQPLARFIDRNPTIVMLALSFLVVIGMTLIAEGFGSHVPKGYIYAAMAFSAFVEGMNMLARRAKAKRAAQASGRRARGAVPIPHPSDRRRIMKCPVCKTPDLLIAERQSIEIDYCPACRGVWLDRGELDKLIARGDGDAAAQPVHRGACAHRDHDDAWRRDRRARDDDRRHEPHRRKKSVFDIFDFD